MTSRRHPGSLLEELDTAKKAVPALLDLARELKTRQLAHLDLEQLRALAFPACSMQPKIEPCRLFVLSTGHPASIGALADSAALLAGATITRGIRAGANGAPVLTGAAEQKGTRL